MTTSQAIELIGYVEQVQNEQVATNTFLSLILGFLIAFSILSFIFMRGR